MSDEVRRAVIKVSGQALAGPSDFGLDSQAIAHIATEILSVHDHGSQVAVMVGGGNILRGAEATHWGIDRAEADSVGMLGTAINAVILRGALKSLGDSDVRVMTALPLSAVAEPYIRLRAIRHLQKGRIVIFGCGIGQPYVTTDYPAVQRALEIEADVLLVAKHGVNGVYTADPRVHPDAAKFDVVTFDEIVERDIRVMDPSAFILAREFDLPIHIFDVAESGAMLAACNGGGSGTRIVAAGGRAKAGTS